jgi:hypothetical protein
VRGERETELPRYRIYIYISHIYSSDIPAALARSLPGFQRAAAAASASIDTAAGNSGVTTAAAAASNSNTVLAGGSSSNSSTATATPSTADAPAAAPPARGAGGPTRPLSRDQERLIAAASALMQGRRSVARPLAAASVAAPVTVLGVLPPGCGKTAALHAAIMEIAAECDDGAAGGVPRLVVVVAPLVALAIDHARRAASLGARVLSANWAHAADRALTRAALPGAVEAGGQPQLCLSRAHAGVGVVVIVVAPEHVVWCDDLARLLAAAPPALWACDEVQLLVPSQAVTWAGFRAACPAAVEHVLCRCDGTPRGARALLLAGTLSPPGEHWLREMCPAAARDARAFVTVRAAAGAAQ